MEDSEKKEDSIEKPLNEGQSAKAVEQLPPELVKVFNEDPDRFMALLETESHYSGPLPPSYMLKEYDEVVPGAADRIIKQFEKQASHRMDMEKIAIPESLKQSSRGQTFGFLIGIGGMLCAGYLAYLSYSTPAVIVALGTLTELAAVFLYGKFFQKKG